MIISNSTNNDVPLVRKHSFLYFLVLHLHLFEVAHQLDTYPLEIVMKKEGICRIKHKVTFDKTFLSQSIKECRSIEKEKLPVYQKSPSVFLVSAPLENVAVSFKLKQQANYLPYPNKGCTFLQLNKQQFWILTSI